MIKGEHIQSVYFLKILALFAVISIHTRPFEDILITQLFSLNLILDQISRFAVPFFFVISGYFWGKKVRETKEVKKISILMFKRVGIIFLAWSFIYLVPVKFLGLYDDGLLMVFKRIYWLLLYLSEHPLGTLMNGSKAHLWFLVGLLNALVISAIFVHIKQEKLLIIVALILYFVGVLSKAYSETSFGFDIGFNTRNGPFFSTIFFVTGFLMSGMHENKRWCLYGSMIAITGICIHFVELYILASTYNISLRQDFVFGTYFMGVGTAMIALSNHKGLSSESASKIGQYVLGIYAVHLVFVNVLEPLNDATNSVMWDVGYILLVFILSATTSMIFAKNKILKQIVR